ncbi:MAG: putative lipid II flippase FtsW [Chitinispirillaceae bacterium]
MERKRNGIDAGILISSLLLLGLGIVFVYSSSFALAQQRFGGADFFLGRQLIRALLGLIALTVFINVDYHALGKASHIGYIAAVVLLVYVLLLPESQAINGAKRWVRIGFLRFQVSEFARIAMIILLAKQAQLKGYTIREGRVFVEQVIKIGLLCFLVVLEPDFSTAALIGVVGMALLFISGAKVWHIAAVGVVCLPVAAMAVAFSPYRRMRLLGHLHLTEHKSDLGYQTYQALIGLGHGGIFGVGLGQGNQKLFYLPEPHTDFVFSILGEEIGFVGLLAVLGIYSFIVVRGLKIAMRAPDRMGQVMAFGITFVLALYVILHACVNTGLVPTTGLPLPFLSYGGMSLVFTMCSIGILLNISSQVQIRE